MDLFTQAQPSNVAPLAERLRPHDLSELVGQGHLQSEQNRLFERLQKGQLQSLILWGPPGCGKTSFALSLGAMVSGRFYSENAIELGAKKIREIGNESKRLLLEQGQKSILFVDEIHRLNRGQQDVLLPYIERGYFYLVGATTENPSYELNSALMSRCRLLEFRSLGPTSLETMALRAFTSLQVSRGSLLKDEAFAVLIDKAHGDGRRLYQLVEELFFQYTEQPDDFPLDVKGLESVFSTSALRFDKKGDEHYDIISAFIKSIRGSDPDAGVYYLARMLEGGEDPLFIARRLLILASEDIGNADPQALTLAMNVFRSVEVLGMPEARITLAQAVTYLSCAPKSNRSYVSIGLALEEVKKSGPLAVPKALRSAQTQLMKELGYGEGYRYSHEGERGWLAQDFLPEKLKGAKYYQPSQRGFEKRLQEYLTWLKGESKADEAAKLLQRKED